jgi:PAS domain S-box-containing protein
MNDISFQKLISNRKNLERILDNLKEGIIAHDIQRRILFFNLEAERVTGFRREDVLGKDCHEVFERPFCGDQCSFCEDQPSIGEKKDYTLNIKNRHGEVRRIEMSVTPMQDEHGQMFGVLASFRDNTDLFCLRMKAEKESGFRSIIGQDSKILQVFQQIRDVADYDYPVHISGETGTGKELVASAIHNESRRKGGPFVPINCGALPEGLLESELFGHVKGAFSGAIRDKKGRFELADNGTIFLDEVADLTKRTQVKLLRFLQEGSLERVGDEKTINVNVRVISATNKDLWQEVRHQRFRDDLYYRLNVIPIRIPALRERKTDIPLLVDHFLVEAATHDGQSPLAISKAALARMMDYHWPGNVREMQNAIQYAIVKCRGDLIYPADLPLELQPEKEKQTRRGPVFKLNADQVSRALATAGGNKAKAARLLGVGRATLYRFLSRHPL